MAISEIAAAAASKATYHAVKFILGNPVMLSAIGGATIYSGIQDIKKITSDKTAQTTGNKIKAGIKLATGAAMVVGGFIMWNDLDWYAHSGMDENFIQLNYGTRRSKNPSQNLEATYGAASFEVKLVRPRDSFDQYGQSFLGLFRTMRAANSGAVTYTEQDLMAYHWNLRALIAFYSSAVRMYGVANLLNTYDVSSPDLYMQACAPGYSTFSYAKHLADLNMSLANCARIIAKHFQAGNMALFERTSWLFANGYMDSDDVKAVPYFFNLGAAVYYTYNKSNGTYSAVTMASPYRTSNGGLGDLTIDKILDPVLELIKTIQDNPYTRIIAGDLARAFGAQCVMDVAIPDLGYVTSLVYSEEVLTQLQNATILGRTLSLDSLQRVSETQGAGNYLGLYPRIDITDMPNVSMEPEFKNRVAAFLENVTINSPKDTISPLEAASYTRFSVPFVVDKTNLNVTNDGVVELRGNTKIQSTGTEVIISGMAFADGGNVRVIVDGLYGGDVTSWYMGNREPKSVSQSRMADLWSQLDWYPTIARVAHNFSVSYDEQTTRYDIVGPIAYDLEVMYDINVNAYLTASQADTINSFVVASLMNTSFLIPHQSKSLVLENGMVSETGGRTTAGPRRNTQRENKKKRK